MIDFLTNPWVIIVIVLSVLIGNIAALKYTAKMKFHHKKPEPPSQDNTTEQAEGQQKTDKSE